MMRLVVRQTNWLVIAVLAVGIVWPVWGAEQGMLELTIQRRDSSQPDADPFKADVIVETVELDPAKTALLIIDAWDYHWCSTACNRLGGALADRENKATRAARQLGITVVHSPTDCSNGHAGWPQREIMATKTALEPPAGDESLCPSAPWGMGLWGGGCICGGPYQCTVSYFNSRVNPDVEIGETDYISSGDRELYNLCKEKGITNLLYTGGHTNMCLVQKPEGMIKMTRLGFKCYLARDITDAFGNCSNSEGADLTTATAVAYIEKHIGPSFYLEDAFRKAGYWKDDGEVVNHVMIRPWAPENRPKFFNDTLAVSLSMPHVREAGAKIHYTLDGSEPTAESAVYEKALTITGDTQLRAAAFAGGKRVTFVSESYFGKLLPEPPMPDAHISDLAPIKINMFTWSEWYEQGDDVVPDPQKDRAYTRTFKGEYYPLRLRGKVYEKGMGAKAPCQLIYGLKPEYERFVAKVGMDESCLSIDNGRVKAAYPSSRFRVFIDGKLMAESPTMRVGQEPWRFNVAIPAGSKVMSLAAMDVGDGYQDDLVEWVNAGFVLKK